MNGSGSKARHLTAQGQDRRDDIIHQAEILFARDGYANTRMTDIADAAGVTKGLLYWYFESKEALIAEILRDTRRRLRDAQREALVGIDDPLERLYLATVAATRFIITNYRLYRISGDGARQLAAVASESSRIHANDTAATLEAGQAQGLVRTNDTALNIAFANTGVVNQMCAAAYYKRIDGTPDEIAHIAARYVLRGCAADTSLVESIESKYGPAPASGSGRSARKGTKKSPAARRKSAPSASRARKKVSE